MSTVYRPTREQIQAECEAIRAEWSPKERAKREGERWNRARVRFVRTGDLAQEAADFVRDEGGIEKCRRTA